MTSVITLPQCSKSILEKLYQFDYSKLIVSKINNLYNVTICFIGGINNNDRNKFNDIIKNNDYLRKHVDYIFNNTKPTMTTTSTQVDLVNTKKRKHNDSLYDILKYNDVKIEICKFDNQCECLKSFNYFTVFLYGQYIKIHINRSNGEIILYAHDIIINNKKIFLNDLKTHIKNLNIHFVDNYKRCTDNCRQLIHDSCNDKYGSFQYHHLY